MLAHLHIRDFAIIDSVEIDLRSGLTVLTGETGAGKSILVDALQLVAGASMDDVLADYLLSNEPMRRAYGPMLEAFGAEGGDAESLSHMMLVEPDYLDAALALMRQQFGDLDGYLATALELTPADVDRLRTRLLG